MRVAYGFGASFLALWTLMQWYEPLHAIMSSTCCMFGILLNTVHIKLVSIYCHLFDCIVCSVILTSFAQMVVPWALIPDFLIMCCISSEVHRRTKGLDGNLRKLKVPRLIDILSRKPSAHNCKIVKYHVF